MKQTKLSFLPRAVLPDVPTLGAVVMSEVAPLVNQSPAAEGSEVSPPAKKPRRELSVEATLEVLRFYRKHGCAATLERFPEVSRATLFRKLKDEAKYLQEAARGNLTLKRRRPLVKYKLLGEALYKLLLRATYPQI